MQVDQTFVPHPAEDALAEVVSEGESQYDEVKRKLAQQEKRITDLEEYSKLQTCAIEHLFSLCGSLQHMNEQVSYMLAYLVPSSNDPHRIVCRRLRKWCDAVWTMLATTWLAVS